MIDEKKKTKKEVTHKAISFFIDSASIMSFKDEEWLRCQTEGQGVLGLFMEKGARS